MSRKDIPPHIRESQLWGGMADVNVDGVADNPNLIRVQLPAEYERDWTVHLPAPIFQNGQARIASGAATGLTPSVDNVDVLITYGGARGITQSVIVDYPAMGRTIGVRGSTVQVSTVAHPRVVALKDPCRIFAELVDAPPPSLTREALPTATGNEFPLLASPAQSIIPVPYRAVEVCILVRNTTVPAGVPFAYRLVAGSASLVTVLDDFTTAVAPLVPVAQSYHSQLRWISIPQWTQGLLVQNGALGAGNPLLTPVFRIAP